VAEWSSGFIQKVEKKYVLSERTRLAKVRSSLTGFYLCPFLVRFEPTKWNCRGKNMSFLILFIQRHEADA
jgi:hypothetical protein